MATEVELFDGDAEVSDEAGTRLGCRALGTRETRSFRIFDDAQLGDYRPENWKGSTSDAPLFRQNAR